MSTLVSSPASVAPPLVSASGETVSRRSEHIARTLTLAVAFAVPALLCLRIACVWDADVWWHLRTGSWILQHHAVPHVDFFSSATAGRPWQAYSWLFEAAVAWLYAKFGLLGIVLYTCTLIMATTVALFRMVARWQKDFATAVLLTLIASFAMSNLYSPRPWHFTILLFILELHILLAARHTGNSRPLAWLPLLFAVWANVHIQFIDGLLLLCLALADATFSWWYRQRDSMHEGVEPSHASPLWLGVALAASLFATLLNPYGWHIYAVAHDLASQSGVANGIAELKAISFRSAPDYCVLLLAFASCAALARTRKVSMFGLFLFLGAASLAFHSQRDIWILVVVATAILACALPNPPATKTHRFRFQTPLAVCGAALLLFVYGRVAHLGNADLQKVLESALPVQAVEVVKARGYPGPVYNTFPWGGFLIGTLQLPVSIDGRAALHGDGRIDRSERTWNGRPDWATDPQLFAAGVVVAPVEAPLTQLLRQDARFRLTYEDHMAAVFVPTRSATLARR